MNINMNQASCLHANAEIKPKDAPTIIIPGATGDLAARKLFPGLYNLLRCRHLDESTSIVALSRRTLVRGNFLEKLKVRVKPHLRNWDENLWNRLCSMIITASFDPAVASSGRKLAETISNLERGLKRPSNRILYLSVPPEGQEQILKNILEASLASPRPDGGYTRIVFEKPFGTDEKSALKLNRYLHAHLDESQIFRIDHYMAKDMIENIYVLRFANPILESMWNRRYIDNIQITISEELGIEGRGHFYEQVGVLGDIVQNHLLQVLALVAMEPPSTDDPENLRNHRMEVFQALRCVTCSREKSDMVFGQYSGYRDEPGVQPGSVVPTFFAARLFIDNWRWDGIPFYIRSGKAMGKRLSRVVIEFRSLALPILKDMMPSDKPKPNRLIIDIQPDERIQLSICSRAPGRAAGIESVSMDFPYSKHYTGKLVDAYEKVILDLITGQHHTFWRSDEITESWRFIDPLVRDASAIAGDTYPNYDKGSPGPGEANELLGRNGHSWYD